MNGKRGGHMRDDVKAEIQRTIAGSFERVRVVKF
jgi:hypothetical protein